MTTQNNDQTTELVIKRIFEASRILVWNAWTIPDYLMKWWGPKFYTSPFCKINLSVGGKYHFCLRSPKGHDFWSTGVYKKIVPLQQIDFTDSFADKDGNIIQASALGFQREWPLELLVTVKFQEFNDRTKIKLKHTGFPTSEATKLAEVGWNESLDKLDLILKSKDKFNLVNLKPRFEIASYDLLAKAETNIQAPAAQVWNALVDPELIKRYMFDTDVVSQWTIGSPIVWKGKWQGKQYEDKGTILDIKKMEMIKYNHFSPLSGQPDIPENYHTVTIKLSSAGERTTVQLTQDNNSNDQVREHSEKMWSQMLEKMKNLLEK
jgi:uncharacterized protein YndB with AHSA1/START domain